MGIAGVLTLPVSAGSGSTQVGANIGVEFNNTGAPVNTSVTVGGSPMPINIPKLDSPYFAVALSDVTINLDNLVEIYGNFTASSGSFSGNGLTLFVGSGPYQTNGKVNSSAIGVLINNASLNYKQQSGGYGLYATGTLAFAGLSGLNVTATVTLQINTTTDGSTVNFSSCTPPGCSVSATPGFSLSATNVDINIAGALDISGTLSITRTADGTLTLAVGGPCSGSFKGTSTCTGSPCKGTACNDAALTVTVSGSQVFDLMGNATFTVDPVNGFQLQSYSLDDVSLLGFDICTVVPGGCPKSTGSTPTLFPTASLATAPGSASAAGQPVNGATVLATPQITTLYVTLSDPNGQFAQFSGSGQPIQVLFNGNPVSNLTIGPPTYVSGTTYSFQVTNFPDTAGLVSVEFVAGSIVECPQATGGTCNTSVANLALVQQFYLVTAGGDTPSPAAAVSSPAPGQPVTAEALNAAGYIDVTYQFLSAANLSTLEAATTAPFTLTGSGVDNIQTSGGFPLLASAPEVVATDAAGTTVTLRYTFANPSGATLFQAGTVTLAIPTGVAAGSTQIITIQDPPMFTSSASVSLGPLTLQGPSFGLEDVGFKDGGLVLTIGIGLNQASFGLDGGSGSQSSSGITASLTGILGTFQLKVDVLGLLGGKFSASPGKFTLGIKTLAVSIPDVVNISASGISVAYDPSQKASTQMLLGIDGAKVTFPKFPALSGTLCSYDTTAGKGLLSGDGQTCVAPSSAPKGDTVIPGLAVYGDGFTLGYAAVTYGNPISLPGGILTLNDLTVGVTDFAVKFDSNPVVSGTINISSTGASLLQGDPISATITQAPGAPTGAAAIKLSLTFTGATVNDFVFSVPGQLTVKLGSYVTLTTTGFNLDTGAIGTSNNLISVSSLAASVNIPPVALTGTATNFAIDGNGHFAAGKNFSVSLSIGGADGSSFQWPSWMPISIQSIGISWPDINTDPGNFTLDLSAGINSISGLSGLSITGAVDNIQIDPALLAQGKFPIVGISGFAITIQGDLFGGQLDAGLVGGILNLDANNNIIAATDTTTPVAQRIPYFAIEGGFSFAGLAGFTIRVGLSSNGPLQAFISVDLPGGLLLDPDTGLTLNDFSAGIEFNTTVTSLCNNGQPLTDPHQLSSCTMPSATAGSAAQWLAQLQQEIVAQAKSGTTWANVFSKPMLIVGSAVVYSIYTSQLLFNAKVSLAFSTDGQILIEGQLNFADNQLSLGAYLYANLTQISSGGLNIMFLAQVPQQLQILVLYGQLQMGFENDAGQPLTYNVTGSSVAPASNPPSVPTASLAAPYSGQSLSQADLTGEAWIDVTYSPFGGSPVDVNSVINNPQPFLLTDSNNDNLTLVGKPVLIDPSTNTFRYFFTGYTQPLTGQTNNVNLTWQGGWDNGAGTAWCGSKASPCPSGVSADAEPTPGSGQITPVFGSWIDVNLATPAGQSVAFGGSLSAPPDPSILSLSGAGAGSLTTYTGSSPVVQVGPNTYRFLYQGSVGTGTVNVSFAAGKWQGVTLDSSGNIATTAQSVASSASFSVVAPAQNFYIQITGGLDVYIPGISQPALDVTAAVKLTVDPTNKVIALTFSGQMSVIYLGTLGYTAGSFVLDVGPDGPNLWGVATVSATYPALAAAGLYLTASGTLEVNTSTQTKNVTLQLPSGPNGAEQAAPYTLQPTSLQIAVTGQAALRPPGTSTDLVDLTGGFYIGVSPQGLQVYAVATAAIGGVQLGQATGLIIISTGVGSNGIPGIAGLLTIGGTASLGLPDVGSLISITGTATVMFNTTLTDQTFPIPAEFLALQAPGDPTSITVYGAPPGLSGQPNPGAAPAVYASVSINAQITIGGVITLTGFVQIEASAGSQGASLSINGAVSTTIPFLGSLSGQVNLTVDVLPTPGVVGRVYLTLDASSIPGVQLNGQFLLELNTFGTDQKIQTYALVDPNGNACDPQTATNCGFTLNSAGDPVTTTVDIQPGPYFSLYMFGNLTLASLITVNGSVAFSIDLNGSNPGISLLVNGTVALGPLGTLDLKDSGFQINKQGLVANINLSLNGGFGGSLGLSFSGSAVMSLNTTGQTVTFGSSQIAPGFDLAISGSVTFAGFATASGAVDVTIQSGVFQLTFNVQFAIGPLDFSANGGAGIYANGANDTGIALALNVNLSISAAVFDISASGTLEINTTGTNHLGIPGDSFLLALNGQVSLLKVLNFNAAITIAVSQTTLSDLQVGPVSIVKGTQTGGWYFEANASVSFFGIATLDGAIFLDANGDFTVSLNGGITIGSSDFGLSGNFSFLLSSQHDTYGGYRLLVSGSANVSVNAFGISLAGVGIDFSVCASTSSTYQCPDGYTSDGSSTPLNLDINIHVHILFVTISGTAHFTLGYIQLPQPVYLGGDSPGSKNWTPISGQAQTLYLNVGSQQAVRNISTDGTSDTYKIVQVGGTASDATIQVTAFGRTETFTDVSNIVGDWTGQNCAGGCQTMVDVGPSVTIPVSITGGPGNNIIIYEGANATGTTTITGGTGANIITASGNASPTDTGKLTIDDSNAQQPGTIKHSGTETATIISGNLGASSGGPGDTIFGGPSGGDIIKGGHGNDVVFGPAASIDLDGNDNQIVLTAGQGGANIGGTGTSGNVLTINGASGGDVISGTTQGGGFAAKVDGQTVNVTSGVQQLVFDGTSGTESFSSFDVNGSNGLSSMNLTAPGPIVITSSDIAAPTLAVTSTGGSVTITGSTLAGPSSLTATGATGVTVQPLASTASDLSGGTVTLTSAPPQGSFANGGPVSISGATLSATAGALNLNATNGAVTVSGATLTSSGETTVNTTAGSVTVSGSTLTATGGGITLEAIAGGGVSVNCTSGATTLTCSSLTASGDVNVTAPAGSVLILGVPTTGATVNSSGGAVNVTAGPQPGTSPAESVTITGATLSGKTAVSVSASSGITIDAGQSPSTLTVTNSGGGISLTAQAGSVSLTNTTLDASVSSGTVDLKATGGNVVLDSPSVTGAAHVNISATGGSVSIQGGSVTATGSGTIDVTGDQNLTVGGAAISAGGSDTLKTNSGTITLLGANVSGASTSVTAASALAVLSGALSAVGTLTLGGTGAPGIHLTGTTIKASTANANATGSFVVDGATTAVAGQDITFIATTSETVLQSSLTATSDNVTLTAQGGDLTVSLSQLTAGNSITGTSTAVNSSPSNDVVVQSASVLRGGSAIDLEADAGAVTIAASSLCAGGTSAAGCATPAPGEVTLKADGGDLKITTTLVSAGSSVTGAATQDVDVTDSTVNAGTTISFTGANNVTVDPSTLTAAGTVRLTATNGVLTLTGATVSGSAITGTAGTDLQIDPTSSLTATTTTTLQGGWVNQPGSQIQLLGTFVSPLLEIYGGNGGDFLTLQPVAIVGYTQLWGGTGNDTITLQLPSIDPGNKYYTSMCPTQASCAPAALDNGTAVETALTGLGRTIVGQNRGFDGQSLFPLRNMVDVNGGAGSDSYIVNLSGDVNLATGKAIPNGTGTDYVVNLHDSGANDALTPTDVNTLTLNGPPQDNTYLLRQYFVALLTADPNNPGSYLPGYERINYDNSINLLHILGGPDNNTFFVDDNSAITVLDGGGGQANFQFGQLYGANRAVTYQASSGVQTLQPGDVVQSAGLSYEYIGVLPFTGDLTSVSYAADTANWAPVPASGVAAANAVAPGDEIATVDTTVGWLSRGISYATTAYGGAGNTTFTVYSNKAPLKLLGAAGDDTFIIRAFQIVNSNQVATSNTLVQGGSGNNLIQYNINAPVSIVGGKGFNTLIVLGTGQGDNFVITKDGVFGAGLYVTYSNIQKLEVDSLGGPATFNVLSTNPDVVTLLNGGNGHPTFNVAGDVTGPVYALNPNGTSSAINNQVSSTDPNYNGIFAAGLPITVAGPSTGGVVVTLPPGGLNLVQDGVTGYTQGSYILSLGAAAPTTPTIWYVTVAVAPDLAADGGSSLQVSTDGGNTWSSAAVVTFDSTQSGTDPYAWDRKQTVLVRVLSGSVHQDSTIEIMHSVLSTDPVAPAIPGFDTVPTTNVDVQVRDGDLAGLVITPADPANGLNVIEGARSDTFTVALTKAPNPGEEVNVTITSSDPRLGFGPSFQLDASHPSQVVTVTAALDGIIENLKLDRINIVAQSASGVYAAGVSGSINVMVYDGNSAGVLVLATGPSVVSPTQSSSYTLQLTSAPASGTTVTISLLSDGATLLTDGRTLPLAAGAPAFSPTGGANNAPTVTFDSTNWDEPVRIDIAGVYPTPQPKGSTQTDPVVVFPAQPHNADQIFGPLIIDGGNSNSPIEYPLVQGFRLPSETDVPLPPPPAPPTPGPAGAVRMATLNVFDDGLTVGDTGTMSTISSQEFAALGAIFTGLEGQGLSASQFNEITGLSMGPGVSFQPPGDPQFSFDGAITYRNVDVVDVMLGSRSHSVGTEGLFTVSATLPGVITVIQGGGGDKKLVATGGGGFDSPLILLGNTTQDGSFYNSTTADLTGHARVYQSPGQSVVDASLDPNPVIIYGGVGDSQIYGGGGGDQIAGGSGSDTIYAGSGNDIIHANDGFNLYLQQPLAQVVAQNLNALIVTHDPSSSDSPTGDPLNPTSDQIYGGIGHDIVFLDHGQVDQLNDPITGTGGVLDAYTTDAVTFGLSSYFGAYNGSSVVLAGTGQQLVDVSHTSQPNVVVKNGYVYFSTPDGWIQHLSKVGSTDPGAGGNDTIKLGNGNDVVVAGTGNDRITGGDGNKIVLGDDGEITWVAGRLTGILSQDPGINLNSPSGNTITLGNGNDIVFGGSGSNTITLGNGNDIVAGADAQLSYDASGQPTTLQSTFPTDGGNNAISVGGGSGVVIAGPATNTVSAGPANVVIAATGEALYAPASQSWSVLEPTPQPVSTPPVAGPPPSSSTGTGPTTATSGSGAPAPSPTPAKTSTKKLKKKLKKKVKKKVKKKLKRKLKKRLGKKPKKVKKKVKK